MAAESTMRAAVVAGPRTTRVERIGRPDPGPGEVRIRVEGCGVCGSSAPVWEGRPWFTYPQAAGAPGHEAWGWIDAVGPDVEGVEVGQRVAAVSYHGFAEYDVARADSVVPLPPSLAGQPFPGEALGCALNVFRRAGIRRGDVVAVVGIGFLGAVVTQLAAGAGARVIAISRRRFALDTALRLGAAETVPLQDRAETIRQVHALTGGAGCARVIEAVGLEEPLNLAAELTCEGGRLVIAGFHQDGTRQIDLRLWNWRALEVVNAHARDPAAYVQGIRDAVRAVEEGALDPAPLYTHAFGLDEMDRAFEALATRPNGFLKALVVP